MINAIIGNTAPDMIGLHKSTKNSVISISLAIFWKVNAETNRIMIGSISAKPFTNVSQNSEKVMIFAPIYNTMQTKIAIIAAMTRSPVTTAMPTNIASGMIKNQTLLPSSSPYSEPMLYFLLTSLYVFPVVETRSYAFFIPPSFGNQPIQKRNTMISATIGYTQYGTAIK